MEADTEYVIIGAGQAGGRAVEALRGAGFAGGVTFIGAEPHPPYERPQLSKDMLLQPDAELVPMFPEDYFDSQEVSLRRGVTATAIDRPARQIHLSDGSTMPYDRLLLATGARVRDLDLPGRALANVHTLRCVEDTRAISMALTPGAAVTVIGGGFIGLEVAAAAAQRGGTVTVLETADRLMGRALPAEISTIFADLHRAHGVDIRLDTGAAQIEGTDAVSAIVTPAGDRIAADLVVIGVGIVPNTELATAAGLATGNGIHTDEFCRTSDPDIYAAGDAANQYYPALGRRLRLESWQNAQNQAIAAARNMCGADAPFTDVPWFWSDQFDVNLQMSGAPDAWDTTVVRGDLAARDGILFQIQNEKLVGAVSLNRPRDMRFVKRLMSAGKSPALSDLADDGVSLRDLAR